MTVGVASTPGSDEWPVRHPSAWTVLGMGSMRASTLVRLATVSFAAAAVVGIGSAAAGAAPPTLASATPVVASPAAPVTPAAAPTITTVDPTFDTLDGGVDVEINGTGLTGITSVRFGTEEAYNVVEFDGTFISVTAPSQTAAGPVDITVTTNDGTVTKTNAFLYITTPNAPTDLVATRGDARMTLSFKPPVFNGWSNITNYEYSINGGGTWTAVSPATKTSPIVVTGLSNGTTYRFAVRAVNAVGPGKPSPVVLGTPATTPTPPRVLVGTPGNTSAKVSWQVPYYNGGSPILRYTVTSNPGARTCVATTSPTCVVTGLVNGTRYTFTAVATNAVGNSPVSAASEPVVPRSVPSAPLNPRVALFPAAGQATIAWSAPASTGGSPITGYMARISGPGSSVFGPWQPTPTASKVFGPLNRGAVYKVQILAKNAAGLGAIANLQFTQAAAPQPVRNLRIQSFPSPRSATVTWLPPTPSGGLPITGYRMRYSDPNSSRMGTWVNGTATTRTLGNLVPGARYIVQVGAVNGQGMGPIASVNFTQPRPPTVVRNPRVTGFPSGTSVSVAWSPPASNGGLPITGYRTRISAPNSSTSFGPWNPTGSTSQTYENRVKGATYRVQMAAVNAAGQGDVMTLVYRQPSAPGPIRNPRISGFPEPGSATVTWLPPASMGGAPVKYTIKIAQVGASSAQVMTVPDTRTLRDNTNPEITIRRLTKGKTYQVQITAVNVAGTSPAVVLRFVQQK